MRHLHLPYALIFTVMLATVFFSCHKDDDKYPRYESPDWNVNSSDYQVSMTAVVDLPAYISPYMTDDDKMAAFIDGTCRGVATLIDGHFYILIKGNPDEQDGIDFEYYNARNRYLYEAPRYITFEADLMVGSADAPEVLPLKVKK